MTKFDNKCACGCGTKICYSKKWKHGHHRRGVVVSQETREKIGKKNSVNMKRYMTENPDVARSRIAEMHAGLTPEVEERRIESTRRTYANMSLQNKEKFVLHAKSLWKNDNEKMNAARKVGAKTFAERKEMYVESGGHGSETWKEKISASVTEKYLSGGFEWSRGTRVSSKTGVTHHYRSSWELRRMEELDADETVIFWEYEPFYIMYPFGGRERRYLPDFVVTYVDGRKEMEEVGVGVLKSGTERNVAKRMAAEEFCVGRGWTFRVVTF